MNCKFIQGSAVENRIIPAEMLFEVKGKRNDRNYVFPQPVLLAAALLGCFRSSNCTEHLITNCARGPSCVAVPTRCNRGARRPCSCAVGGSARVTL